VTRLPSYFFLIIGKYKQTAEIKLVYEEACGR